MATPPQRFPGKFGWLERTLFAFFVLYVIFSVANPGSAVAGMVAVGLILTGLVVLFRVARQGMHRLIWRLRNRLIVAYLFIAVVPILLILIMAAITSYAVI